jgi:CheY-like chemotaxis protein
LAPVPVIRFRIVILETGDTLKRLFTRYLDNIEIVSVTNLDEAFKELSTVPTQALLINDISIGDTLKRIQTSVKLPYGTPAIICSVPGLSEAASALGVIHYLVKPISRESLLTALEGLPLRGKTILIVDDEPDARRLFWRILSTSNRGYRVLTASDGQQAMDILRAQHPDVILLDLVMPEMDGFQLLAAKNDDPTLRDIPIIIISARDPASQPIVSNALAATRGGGLSIPQLLASIEALTRILVPSHQPGDPVFPTIPSD